MAGSSPAESGRIFISYRREESAYPAGWLYDRLTDRFGRDQVFKDVDSIELGDDFVEVITRAVGACDVLLALIGPEWVTITDAHRQRRLDNPDDFVRLEIEAALTRNVRVIPILVDGASMPHAAELPESLARLVRRQALELSPSRFAFDTGRLLKVLDRTLAEVRTEHDDAASLWEPAEKAPDPITPEVQEAPERREQAEPSPTPSVSPATPAAPFTARPTTEQSKLPDPSTTARANVADSRMYKAELVERSDDSRLLRVTLTTEVHMVEFRANPLALDLVLVDGEVAAREKWFMVRKRIFSFTLSDGRNRLAAMLRVRRMNSGGIIAGMMLLVAGQPVYSEGHVI